jgi:large subunit ribosomal protein L6
MSRIGKKPVDITKGVDVAVKGRMLRVKGPKGELNWEHPDRITVTVEGEKAVVGRADDSKATMAFHGLTRSLLQNMLIGVSTGFQKVLEIHGVGYKAQVEGNKIVLSLGYSHPIEYVVPDGITVEADKKQVQLTISGIDKQKVGQVAAEIRGLRKPDAYKGKGVRYSNERVRLKAGKAAK